MDVTVAPTGSLAQFFIYKLMLEFGHWMSVSCSMRWGVKINVFFFFWISLKLMFLITHK